MWMVIFMFDVNLTIAAWGKCFSDVLNVKENGRAPAGWAKHLFQRVGLQEILQENSLFRLFWGQ